MPKVEFFIDVQVRLHLKYDSDIGKSTHIGCDYTMNTSKNTDLNAYLDEEGLPNKQGTDAVVKTLTSGLAAAIHAGHQKGFKNDAECLREVIDMLEQQFIIPADITKGRMTDEGTN